ncbi:MAG: hypothetical protein ABRQ25_12125 [Clostridiaceae bacterium]
MDRIQVLENEIERLKRSLYSASDRMIIYMEIEKITEELRALKIRKKKFWVYKGGIVSHENNNNN